MRPPRWGARPGLGQGGGLRQTSAPPPPPLALLFCEPPRGRGAGRRPRCGGGPWLGPPSRGRRASPGPRPASSPSFPVVSTPLSPPLLPNLPPSPPCPPRAPWTTLRRPSSAPPQLSSPTPLRRDAPCLRVLATARYPSTDARVPSASLATNRVRYAEPNFLQFFFSEYRTALETFLRMSNPI